MSKVIVNINIDTASGNRRGWAKALNRVDPDQKGGYALIGEFLKDGEALLEVGSIIADCRPTGSVKSPRKEIHFGIVTSKGEIDWQAPTFLTPQESESMKNFAQEMLDAQKSTRRKTL